MSGAPRGPVGFLDALREGCLIGWARDAVDPAAVALVRVMRGMELLAEGQCNQPRQDGLPGFRIPLSVALRPEDLLEGRVRVRAFLPGRQAAVTLAMSAQMRADLESAAGWEPTTAMRGRTAAPAAAPAPAPEHAPEHAPGDPPEPEHPPEPPAQPAEAPQPARPRALPPRPAPSTGRPVGPPPPPRPAPVMPAPAVPRPAPEPPAAAATPEEAPPALRRALPLPPRPVAEPPPPPEPQAEPQPEPQAEPPPALPPPVEPEPVPAPVVAEPSTPLWQPDPAPPAPPPAPAPSAPAEPPPALAAEHDAGPEPASLADRLRRLAAAVPAGTALLHLVVPSRAATLSPEAAPAFLALEAEAAADPRLAADWVPLRHAFAADPAAPSLWRHDGRRLSIEGGLLVLRAVLAVLRARLPGEAATLARAEAVLARADLAGLPRRDPPDAAAEGAPAFLGVPVRETEPALTEAIFFDLQPPRALAGLPGLEAWASPAAPLPWRVVVLTQPGLGGSAHPSALGWWLRWLVAECVVSEALESAPPGAVLGLQPGLVLTLAQVPEDAGGAT
jgi:hypothetical protein